MTPAQLESFLHENVILTQHMQVKVKTLADDRLELVAPLGANSNHHGTAFGGSIASLAVLCGWGWLHVALCEQNIQSALVIQKTEMDYIKGIDGELLARCMQPAAESWQSFIDTLQKHGRARLKLEVDVVHNNAIAAQLHATYAAKLT